MRNFAKSSTYLNKKISVDDSTPRQEQIFKKEKVVFKDKKKYKQLNEKISAMEREYSSKVKDIFADLYPAILEVKAEFEEEMQIYNRHEQQVGISL